jgi:hypothetical protein
MRRHGFSITHLQLLVEQKGVESTPPREFFATYRKLRLFGSTYDWKETEYLTERRATTLRAEGC